LQRQQLEKDMQNATLTPGNISADAHGYIHPFSKLWRVGKSG